MNEYYGTDTKLDRLALHNKLHTLALLVIGIFIVAGSGSTASAQLSARTAPAPLNTNATTDSGSDSNPQLMTDGSGTWIAVWQSNDDLGATIGTDLDILLTRSVDDGVTWSAPEPLNTNATTDSGSDLEPQLTTDGLGTWIAVWGSWDDLGATIGTDLDILLARSVDDGVTWSAPEPLNTNATTDSGNDLYPQLTTDGLGTWIAVWNSEDDLGATIGTDLDILLARSVDDGATWSAPEPLNTNADTDTEWDRNPQLTTDGSGTWIAVWNSEDDLGATIGTDWDILVARSADDGVTWSAPEPLNTNATTDSGSDLEPQLTTDGSGTWIAVWGSEDDLGATIGGDYDILLARSVDDGATWSAPEALNTNAATDTGADYIPALTTDGLGTWIAVWYATNDLGTTIGTDWDILVAHSVDDGATWSAPEALNTNATTDSGSDLAPQLTTDGSGTWIAVWESNDDLGATIGTDWDILESHWTVTTQASKSGGGGSSGCFIATAAFGTPLAQEIDTLRLFRDQYLLNNPMGTAFVDTYYRVSPPIAQYVAQHPAVAHGVRLLLTPIIALLNLFSSTSPLQMALLGILLIPGAVYIKKQKAL